MAEKKASTKKKAASRKPGTGKRSRMGKDATIELLVNENPFRPTSSMHKEWGVLKNGMTVKAARAAGVRGRCLRTGARKLWLRVHPAPAAAAGE